MLFFLCFSENILYSYEKVANEDVGGINAA